MAGYDASDALDDLFDDDRGYAVGAGTAVEKRTEAILDGPKPADSIDAVLRLADGLPSMDAVREVTEGDTSDLTELELEQKAATEEVIRTALATGDASVWVIAQGLERAAKGKWWRRTHTTLGAYVEELTGRSAVYGRQLRKGLPLALETAKQTGVVPNPGQIKETRKTERQHGTHAAVTLFDVVREVSAALGERPTAASLRAVHEELPAQLPTIPDQQRAVIEQAAQQTLGLESAAIAAPAFGSESNTGAAIAAPGGDEGEGSTEAGGAAQSPSAGADGAADDGIEDAEIVPEHLVTLKDTLKKLRELNKTVTQDVFIQAAAGEADHAEYLRVRNAIIKSTTELRTKALRAPKE
ncbi:hypothetical protein ACJ6WD_35400 [Streptomyces sp. VTCC 41912]|uniref:hypothetical protein n=1 Tax=Streptomyces sp. VTCC 41912 TaxID=3383243 RepID=UPI0038969B01